MILTLKFDYAQMYHLEFRTQIKTNSSTNEKIKHKILEDILGKDFDDPNVDV